MPLRFPLMLALALPMAQAPSAPPPAAPGAVYAVELTLTHAAAGQRPEIQHFTLRVRTGPRGDRLDLGERIPVMTAKDQYTYERIGTSLNCSLQPAAAGELELRVNASLNSVAQNTDPNTLLPRLDSVTLQADTSVPLDRQVTVATASGATPGETYRLDARVTTPGPASTNAAGN